MRCAPRAVPRVALLADDGSKDRYDYEHWPFLHPAAARFHRDLADARCNVVALPEFGYERFELSADLGLVMLVYTVEPGSATAEAMALLNSWHAPTTLTPLLGPTQEKS